jgi:GNAT superfamily N-acetyltransferase
MKAYTENDLMLRPATEEDVPVILKFILELAEFEGVRDQIRSTCEGLRDVLFVRHITDALIAELSGTPIGFAIWAYSFSTFTGKPTLYIDDLYVQEQYRGKGIGSRIFSRIAEIAYEKDCGRMDWYCMETNVSGKEYYHKMGAEEIDWFKVFRLDRKQIEEMRDRK